MQAMPYPAGGLASLRALVAEAASEVRGVRRAEQEARRLVRRTEAAEWRLTARQSLALAVALELGAEAPLAPILVRQLSRRLRGCAPGRRTAVARAEATRIIEDDNMRSNAAAKVSATPGGSLVFCAARRLAEVRAALWLRRANAAGVAASQTQLLAALRRSWPALAFGERAERFFATLGNNPRYAIQVAQKFRVRFNVSWRRLPARGDVPDAVLTQRVPSWSKIKKSTPGGKKNIFFIKKRVSKGQFKTSDC